MKLTDQEQVILKAIGSGVAEVSRVIRSVGYPKATVKKVLVRLSEKGVVSLHRHDWPQSLTPDQRKMMVRIGRDYFNAVSMRKRNPQKSKGKTALKKTGRALKGFARGALGAASQIFGAGAEALNPTRRRKKPNKTIIKAGRIDHLDVAKVHNPRKGRTKKKASKSNAARTIFAASTAKRRARSSSAGRKKATVKSRSKVRPVAKKRKVTTRRASKRTVKRRNAAKKITVRKFDVFQRRPEYVGTPSEWGKLGTYSASSASGAITKFKAWYKKAWGDDVPTKYELRAVASNPHRRNPKQLTPEAQALIDRLKREKKITYTNGPLWEVIDAYPELFQKEHRARGGSGYWIIKLRPGVGKKRNPSAESIRKTFAGSVNGERDLFFPQGTPSGKLAKLGKLVSISTEAGTIKPVHGTAWLCADTKGKLHIGSTSNAPLFNGPARNFGHVTKLEYESSKPHLGYGPTIWFHKAGEENGIRPTLRADGKGGLVFRGGDYRLTERGIEN